MGDLEQGDMNQMSLDGGDDASADDNTSRIETKDDLMMRWSQMSFDDLVGEFERYGIKRDRRIKSTAKLVEKLIAEVYDKLSAEK